MEKEPLVKVGLMSGLNYGSEGCRVGLWRLAGKIFEEEKTNFVVLAGGLVDYRELNVQLKEALRGARGDEAEIAKDEFLNCVADEIARMLPVIPGIKIYVVTSPAYDGQIGAEIAYRLTERREDVLLYREGSDRLELKKINKVLGVYVPKKGIWMRGDYYDTPILRVLKDEKKRSSRSMGDMNVVGCLGCAVTHPGDSSEIKKSYLSLPLLYKIADTRIAENQIGIRILEFHSDNPKEATVVTYNFKDLISNEWDFIKPPRKATKIQKAVIRKLQQRGALRAGQLEDCTDYQRSSIEGALESLLNIPMTSSWPGLEKDPASRRYFFSQKWFREKLDYPLPKTNYHEDSFLAFGCLHASCKHTDSKYFRDVVPGIILEKGIENLVGAGDFIEGLRHDLMLKGEILGSQKYVFNYTMQEKLAAYLVGSVIMKVFEERFGARVKSGLSRKAEQEELEKVVKNALLTFIYIPGNHCGWVAPLGFDSLAMFRAELKAFLVHHIHEILVKYNLTMSKLHELVSEKIVKLELDGEYKSAPGRPSLSIFHPEMAGTKTTSIRPQQMLRESTNQIVIGANFHTAEAVEEWDFDRGQRVCLQVGTVKVKSGFERSKLKTVDFGVGVLRVYSCSERIMKTKVSFHGERSSDLQAGNLEVLEDFDKWLEVSW